MFEKLKDWWNKMGSLDYLYRQSIGQAFKWRSTKPISCSTDEARKIVIEEFVKRCNWRLLLFANNQELIDLVQATIDKYERYDIEVFKVILDETKYYSFLLMDWECVYKTNGEQGRCYISNDHDFQYLKESFFHKLKQKEQKENESHS